MCKSQAFSHVTLSFRRSADAAAATPGNHIRQRQPAECPLAGSTGFFKNPHHGQIVIRFWRMPGKEEINHLAHRDLIGLRGKVKASLGSASRRDESAPDEQLRDFRRFSF